MTSVTINLTTLGIDTMPRVFISSNGTTGIGNVGSVNSFQQGTTQVGGGIFVQSVGDSPTVLRASAGEAPLTVTLSDFGAGSSAVLSGLLPDHFSLQVADVTRMQAPALMLTASPDAAGYGATAIVTLVGYSSGDLASGRLSATFGPDSMTGIPSLLIHAGT